MMKQFEKKQLKQAKCKGMKRESHKGKQGVGK